MRKMTTIAVLAAASMLALTACSGGASPGGGSSEGGGSADGADPMIGIVMKDTTNEAFRRMVQGIEESAAAAGIPTNEQSPLTEADVQGQIAKVQSMIANEVSTIVISPDGVQLIPVLTEAVNAGIEVILIDSKPEGWDGYSSYVGTDGEAVGHAAIKKINEIVESPEIGIVSIPGSPPVAERIKGVTAELETLGLTAVQTVNGEADQQVSQNVVEDMLRANPQVNAIFACCGTSSLGAAQAARTSGADFVIVGVDGTDPVFQAIKAGQVDATIDQGFIEMGKAAGQYAVDLINGESVPKDQMIPFTIVTEENVDDYLQ